MVLLARGPPCLGASASVRQPCNAAVRPSASWVPDYGLKRAVPKKIDQATSSDDDDSAGLPARKWWDYTSPKASLGRASVQLKAVALPQVSPGGGGGGSSNGNNGSSGGGGSGGGGSGSSSGSGGDAMRGPTYLFASLLFAGGLAAFFRKGSHKSLLFASAAAILLLISASLLHHRSGKLLALGTCLVLAAVMGQRANRSGKVFPAGVVAILGALMTAGYARSLA